MLLDSVGPRIMPRKTYALISSRYTPILPPLPSSQNQKQLKPLNLNGNSLSTLPGLPLFLLEFKCNDHFLQGLQHRSFWSAGKGNGPGQLEEAAKTHKQGSIRVSSPSLSAFLKRLSQLLMLGMQGNELHDRNISPQVLSTQHTLEFSGKGEPRLN